MLKNIFVVAAAIFSETGEILLARRPAGKPLAGFWEFPGGKIESGERPEQALVRELQEELGITAKVFWPSKVIDFITDDRRLHFRFFRVMAFSGTPAPLEGQVLTWTTLSEINRFPMPAPNVPLLQSLRLPSFYAISGDFHDAADFAARLAAIPFSTKALWLQLRFTAAQQEKLSYRQAVEIAHKAGRTVLVNADYATYRESAADGWHVNSQRLAEFSRENFALAADAIVFASCHTAEDLAKAQASGVDAALLSPILPTASHPDASPLGWPALAEAAAQHFLPIYALGGVKPADLPSAQAHGGIGIAAIRGLWPQ